jgi:hypothetical protein
VSTLPRQSTYRGFTVIADATGVLVVGLGGFGSVADAHKAIDDHLDKSKEPPPLPGKREVPRPVRHR